MNGVMRWLSVGVVAGIGLAGRSSIAAQVTSATVADSQSTVAAKAKAEAASKVAAAERKAEAKAEHPRPWNEKSLWGDVTKWDDPTAPLLAKFLEDQAKATITPTTVTRLDYIRLAADNVSFWRKHQQPTGAIVDPFRHEEWQYSTPCFALAGIASVVYLDRQDLLEPAARAMDWACLTLSQGRAANHHEDFFAPVLAHALVLFQGKVPAERWTMWRTQLASYDPYRVYRSNPGRGNWNVVALSGEYLFKTMGIRSNIDFVEDSLAGQGGTFGSKWGLYLEGPMPYDLFPRMWAADMMVHGYDGKYAAELGEMLRRGALTSMFIQSPWGELPLGHRSAHHQWNEAEQAVVYEIYCARALAENKPELAGAFKRAAHLAFSSMKRWQRPSGELYINKNREEPEEFHGYEGYSGHSQYNLLPMAMLVMAYENGKDTEAVKERPSPADVGGFVVELRELHKVFANAGGTYVELETNADMHYDVTGLVRIHFKGTNPQLGPSDVLTTHTSYTLPKVPRVAAAIGPRWKVKGDEWQSLAELGNGAISSCTVTVTEANPERVKFDVSYASKAMKGPKAVVETLELTPGKVKMDVDLPGYTGAAQLQWPVWAFDGKRATSVAEKDDKVTVFMDQDSETFQTPGAASLEVSQQKYPNRNGWARLATAEFTSAPLSLIVTTADK